MGSVRFELTIDGSLRDASVLQRIITLSEDPIVHHLHHAKTAGARRHAGLGHDPLASTMSTSDVFKCWFD